MSVARTEVAGEALPHGPAIWALTAAFAGFCDAVRGRAHDGRMSTSQARLDVVNWSVFHPAGLLPRWTIEMPSRSGPQSSLTGDIVQNILT
jgi:hypothetical protein